MKELIFTNNTAHARIDSNTLKSQNKPYLSFDYDELFFTQNDKFYIINSNKKAFAQEEIDEIDGFVTTLFNEKDKYELSQAINSLQSFLDSTDWMVIRQIETNKQIPENIKQKREDARAKISEMRRYL